MVWYSNGGRTKKPVYGPKCLYSNGQPKWSAELCDYHLNTLHPYCLIFRCPVFRFFLMLALLRRTSFWPPSTSTEWDNSALTIQATTAGLINYLFSLKNSRPCQELNPGPPRYQANMLPTELSWLGFRWLLYSGLATKHSTTGHALSFSNTGHVSYLNG